MAFSSLMVPAKRFLIFGDTDWSSLSARHCRIRNLPVRALIALSLFFGSGLRPAASQEAESPPTVQATRLDPGEQISLDGRLSEPVWTRAQLADGFLQQEPVEGQPGTEATEVRIVFDQDNLYIGAMLHDSDPTGILGYQKQRDQGLGSDDRFMLILDTFLDGRTAYFFETNPAGLMGDGLLRTGGNNPVNKSWDGIWEAQTARGDFGWSAEIRIPFRTLNFNQTADTWGINFQRTVRRKNEETLWSGHRRNQGLFRPIHAGRLTGVRNVSQGAGLEAIPYGAAAWRDVVGTPTETPLDIGIDLNYSVTSSLRAALTVNTDFAETEVDRRRVNLTRFPLFFPEQRDFFLEGASVFDFSPLSFVRPYFSRRIGLAGGQAIPIVYGARLAGQAGAYDLGVLQVRTGELDDHPNEDFTVGRLKRNLFRQSTVGLIYTRRATASVRDELEPPDRHTIGADLDLSTSTFLGDKNLQFEGFYVWHTDPIPNGASTVDDRSARGIRLNYPNDIWQMHVSYREFGNEWDPALGFVQRRGIKRVNPSITYAPRPARFSSVRQLEFRLNYQYLTDLDNRLLTRQTSLTLLGINYESGDRVNLQRNFRFERLDSSFEIHPGVVLPIGGYSFNQWVLNVNSASRRRLSGRASLSKGELWSGDQSAVELGLTIRPYQGVTASTEWEHEDVDLPEGHFTTDLIRLIGSWHLSPWASLSGNLQYDTVSQIAGLYTRLRWILEPGSDFYFVYTQNWQDTGDRFSTLSRGATTKINYTHRF